MPPAATSRRWVGALPFLAVLLAFLLPFADCGSNDGTTITGIQAATGVDVSGLGDDWGHSDLPDPWVAVPFAMAIIAMAMAFARRWGLAATSSAVAASALAGAQFYCFLRASGNCYPRLGLSLTVIAILGATGYCLRQLDWSRERPGDGHLMTTVTTRFGAAAVPAAVLLLIPSVVTRYAAMVLVALLAAALLQALRRTLATSRFVDFAGVGGLVVLIAAGVGLRAVSEASDASNFTTASGSTFLALAVVAAGGWLLSGALVGNGRSGQGTASGITEPQPPGTIPR